MKTTIFHSHSNTYIPPQTTDNSTLDEPSIHKNNKTIHSHIVQQFLTSTQNSKVLNTQYPPINPEEESLPRHKRTLLSQLRTNKSHFLLTYKNKINPNTYPSPICPLCKTEPHTTSHLFTCPAIPTTLTPQDFWSSPVKVSELLDTWGALMDAQP